MKKRSTTLCYSLLLIVGCQNSLNPVSSRKPENLIRKEFGTTSIPLDLQQVDRSTKVYVKQKRLAIKQQPSKKSLGSLFDPSREENFLFSDRPMLRSGMWVDLNLRDIPPGQEASDEEQRENENDDVDPDLAELLQQLPQFEPVDGSSQFLKKIRVQLMTPLSHDRWQIRGSRSLQNSLKSKQIEFFATVSDSSLEDQQLYLSDLYEIQFNEESQGDSSRSESTVWLDEYTIKLSDFREADSKLLREIEDKRRNLIQLREQLREKIVSLGQERKLIAKERSRVTKVEEGFAEKFEEAKEANENLQSEIENLKTTISEQQETIKELNTAVQETDQAEQEAETDGA